MKGLGLTEFAKVTFPRIFLREIFGWEKNNHPPQKLRLLMLQQLKFSRQKKTAVLCGNSRYFRVFGGEIPAPFLGDMAVDHQGHFFHKAMKGGDSETLANYRILLGTWQLSE